jgi:anti-sigma B factor antagonist
MVAVSDVLDVQVRHEAGCAVVTVTGEVDAYTHAELRARLLDADAQGAANVIIDAAGIEFIDSSGIGALIGAHKRAVRRRGHLLIAAPEERFSKMLRIMGLHRVFLVVDSVKDAIDELERRAKEMA